MPALPEKMKVIEISEYGAPDVLKTAQRELPQVLEHEVLIKIAAAGVNGPDMMQRKGLYPPPKGASDLMGLEVSGKIVAKGNSVTNCNIGDNICALTNGGGYAEYVAVDASHCLPIPENVSFIDAAGLCETFFTVWSNLFYQQTIKKGSLLLVHGGSGGIGSTAIQLGAQFRLRTFATCSTHEKQDYCLDLGAERAINYQEEDFVETVKEAGGADLIIDIVGGEYIERNFKAANQDGKIIQLAFRTGSKVDVNLMPIMLKRLILTGSTLRPRTPKFKAAIAADLREKVWPLFAKGTLKTQTHKVFSFDNVSEAHEMMEAAEHIGKILLSPN